MPILPPQNPLEDPALEPYRAFLLRRMISNTRIWTMW